MHLAQDAVNAEWKSEGRAAFGLGIGISTGPVAAALLGSEERVEYTVVGDAVNLCQRLQQFAEPGQTVLSETTWASLGVNARRCRATRPATGQRATDPGRRLPHRARPRRSDDMSVTTTIENGAADTAPLPPSSWRWRCAPLTARSRRTPHRCGRCAAPTC